MKSIRYRLGYRYILKCVQCSLSNRLLRTEQGRFNSKMMTDIHTDTVSVRNVDEEEQMQIKLHYGHAKKQVKLYNLNRTKSEEIVACLERLRRSIENKVNKRKWSRGANSNESELKIEINLQKGNNTIDPNTTNEASWQEGTILTICDKSYDVKVNLPCVTSLKLPTNIMSGFPIFPKVSLEFADIKDCKFIWYVSQSRDQKNKQRQTTVFEKTNLTSGPICNLAAKTVNCTDSNLRLQSDIQLEMTNDGCSPEAATNENCDFRTESLEKLSKDKQNAKRTSIEKVDINSLKWKWFPSDYTFTPDNLAVGHYVKLQCKPHCGTREGWTAEVVSTVTVSAGPGYCPLDARHLFTESYTEPGRLRLITYNILADLYADSDFSRQYLFPYCPPYALAMDYRKQLLLKEISGYHGDIVCLQEVDEKIYKNDIQPGLSVDGLASLLKVKGGLVSEGLVTAYRTDRLRLIGQHDVVLSDLLTQDEVIKGLVTEVIASNTELSQRLLARTTALQISALELTDQEGKLVCVANTHLYYHPNAGHIRVLQMVVCLNYLQRVIADYSSQGYTVCVMLCGDLNSSPKKGCAEFIMNGRITPEHDVWMEGGNEEYKEGLNYSHNLKLYNACPDVAYTNYAGTFSDVLDYIFLDSNHFEVTKVVPPPTHDEVTQYTALPSVIIPSDHIALICEVRFKD